MPTFLSFFTRFLGFLLVGTCGSLRRMEVPVFVGLVCHKPGETVAVPTAFYALQDHDNLNTIIASECFKCDVIPSTLGFCVTEYYFHSCFFPESKEKQWE